MRIEYTTSNGRLRFETEVSTAKEAFEWLASIQELFEEPACGLCHGTSLQCDVRAFDGNAYYKLACRDCGATLDCGQRRDGSNLFIKRKDAEGHALSHRGWYHYTPSESTRLNGGQPAARRSVPPSRGIRTERPAGTRGETANRTVGEPVPF